MINIIVSLYELLDDDVGRFAENNFHCYSIKTIELDSNEPVFFIEGATMETIEKIFDVAPYLKMVIPPETFLKDGEDLEVDYFFAVNEALIC